MTQTEADKIRSAAASLEAAHGQLKRVYEARTPASSASFKTACRSMPGGTTRSNLHFAPYPPSIQRAESGELIDIDGNRYFDFLSDFAVAMSGHNNAVIAQAVGSQLEKGISFGARTPLEARLAQLVQERIASVERVRFVNSGTEANLYAFLAARAFTGRSALLLFEGGYHGGAMSFSTADPRLRAPFEYLTVPYNDADAFSRMVEERGDDIACVGLELLLNSGGAIPARPDFVQTIREVCTRRGILLVIDEVMTTRLAYGGLQSVYGVRPDLTTLGKMIGGGLTVGAFGGRADIMSLFDLTVGAGINHGGSFNNNVLTMAAGIAALGTVLTPEVIESVNRSGELLRERLNSLFSSARLPLVFSGHGSVMALHLGYEAPLRFKEPALSKQVRSLFHMFCLVNGVWIAQRGMIALNIETREAHIARLVEVVGEFVLQMKEPLSDFAREFDAGANK